MSGEYEDGFNYIIGSYPHKEKAEQELEKLNEALNEQYAYYQKCSNCPAQFGCSESEIDKIKESCDCLAVEDDESLIVFCKNAVYSYDESVRYEIEETDVDDEEVKE